MPLWLELISMVGGLVVGCILLGLVVGVFYLLSDFNAGLAIVVFAVLVVGSLIYGLASPGDPPRLAGDPYEQHYQDLGTPGGGN